MAMRSGLNDLWQADAAAAAFAGRLPAAVSLVALAFDQRTDLALTAADRVAIGGAAPQRQREFAAGRLCARRAMQRLGLESPPIPIGPDRAPVWPPDSVGSISHCEGFAMAAVSTRATLRTIGVDCERRARVSPDLITLVCREEERGGAGLRRDDDHAWLTALFSAKEALFKAHYALRRRMFGFQDAAVRFSRDAARFSGWVHDADHGPMHFPNGVIHVENGRVYTATWLEA